MFEIANVLQPIIDASEAVLRFWHDTIGDFEGSWGVSIILLTFTIRLLILPLTFSSVKSMQKLQVLQPEMKKIQERYKDDKQRMNQEMMRFYQENKVNPLASCLPLLLQLPFFISLFYLLRSDSFKSDIEGNDSFLFIEDLAHKVDDPVVLGVLIVLYVGTQLIASMITMVGGDKTQQRIMFALPFVFTIFIINFEAGLILYWITTNVWTIGQQLLVRKLYPKPDMEALKAEADAKDARDAKNGGPARGKPPAATDGKPTPPAKGGKGAKTAKGAKGVKTTDGKGAGNGAAKPPPSSPRKKKKRSGRRR